MNIVKIEYQGTEQFYLNILYTGFVIGLIAHGQFIQHCTVDDDYEKIMLLIVVNISATVFLIANSIIRSTFVYQQLNNTLNTWIEYLYGQDDLMYPWNPYWEMHPPGYYILTDFYEQGSKYYLAQLNFWIETKDIITLKLNYSAQTFVGDYVYPSIIYTTLFLLLCVYLTVKARDSITLYKTLLNARAEAWRTL